MCFNLLNSIKVKHAVLVEKLDNKYSVAFFNDPIKKGIPLEFPKTIELVACATTLDEIYGSKNSAQYISNGWKRIFQEVGRMFCWLYAKISQPKNT